jgi:pyridoxal phosphate enzyme (YggS family)
MSLLENYASIQGRIEAACKRASRAPSEVQLIWVSKTHPISSLLEAHAAGARIFGENRVQEVLEKFPLPGLRTDDKAGAPDYELHLIGSLQRNKVRKVLPLCSTIHSVDSLALWEALDRVSGELGLRRDVLLQVNTSRESAKSGFEPLELMETLEKLAPAPNLNLIGLMTLGPVEGGEEAARACFRELASLLKTARERFLDRYPGLAKLSMGMSGDFETAIEEGAHFVRVGTALFGTRP